MFLQIGRADFLADEVFCPNNRSTSWFASWKQPSCGCPHCFRRKNAALHSISPLRNWRLYDGCSRFKYLGLYSDATRSPALFWAWTLRLAESRTGNSAARKARRPPLRSARLSVLCGCGRLAACEARHDLVFTQLMFASRNVAASPRLCCGNHVREICAA